jgi:hypothetical protein
VAQAAGAMAKWRAAIIHCNAANPLVRKQLSRLNLETGAPGEAPPAFWGTLRQRLHVRFGLEGRLAPAAVAEMKEALQLYRSHLVRRRVGYRGPGRSQADAAQAGTAAGRAHGRSIAA